MKGNSILSAGIWLPASLNGEVDLSSEIDISIYTLTPRLVGSSFRSVSAYRLIPATSSLVIGKSTLKFLMVERI